MISGSATCSTDMKATKWGRSRFAFALSWLAWFLMGGLLLRVIFWTSFAPAGHSLRSILLAFAQGTYRDFSVALIALVPLFTLFLIFPRSLWARRWPPRIFWLVAGIIAFASTFVMFVEYFFFEEFKSRFNTVAVDYLIYPHEVFVNIWESYHVGIIVAFCAVVAAAWVWLASQWFRNMFESRVSRPTAFAWLGTTAALAIVLCSGMQLGPPQVSSDRTLNEIANNGAVSLVYAFWTHHLDYPAFYRTIALDDAYARTRRLLAQPGTHFEGDGRSIRRTIEGDPTRPRLNVVLCLEESLGSTFWGCLGRTNTLTPEMDRLATQEGLLFTNLYASGNRTVRGMEGVLSSFPPLPGDSIVKREFSDNVESLARVLKRDGYTNLFLYGGRGIFDSMRSYAVRNGYDRFIEQKDFPNPVFTTAWGVSDEDLFARGIEEFRALSKTGQPFFATLLTVSNHRPYTFPPGRIAEDPSKKRRNYAVKYADYALGQFFRAAKQEAFWTNTIFVVVADHGARVYGRQTIPIQSYEIPLVILGPAVVKDSERVGALGCSLDVAPTVLGLLGRPYESMFFGRDLLKSAPGEGFAWMNHNRDIGLFDGHQMAVLGLMKSIEHYVRPTGRELTPEQSDPGDWNTLDHNAEALFQVADDLYTHRAYAIDTTTAPEMALRKIGRSRRMVHATIR